MRIDSHQHFWNYDPAQHTWMTGDMAALKIDYTPQDLEPLLQACHLNGCVAVQASQTETENAYLLKLAEQSSVIKGIVGWVDLQAPDVWQRLEYYRQFAPVKGFRHVIHDEPDVHFMLRPAFIQGVKSLRNFNYTYDILIFPVHLPDTVKFVAQLPDQLFVIDHLGKPGIKAGTLTAWKKALQAVAGFENVYCKISGMVTQAAWQKWKQDDFSRYIDVVLEAFGINRVMYGSDWPVCTLSASYEAQYAIVRDYFLDCTEAEQAKFFGGNAIAFYNV